MSNDMDYDDMDYDNLFEEELTPEEIFKMVTLDKRKGVSRTIELKDEENDVVLVPEVIEGLLLYMKDKMENEKDSDLVSQIMPLMSQSLVSGLGRLIGIRETGILLSDEVVRFSLIQMMSMSLLLLKFIQKEGLKIYTLEEKITEEEYEDIQRRSKAISTTIMASTMGINPQDMLNQLLKQGKITKEDIEKMTGEINDDTDDNGN